MARPKMTNNEAFNLINTFLHKEAEGAGEQGSAAYMLGYAFGVDPAEYLIKRMTDKWYQDRELKLETVKH